MSTLPDNMVSEPSSSDLAATRSAPASEAASGGWLWLLVKLVVVSVVSLMLVVVAVRHYLLPRVAYHSEAISQAVEEALGVPLRFDGVSAQWKGLRPRVVMAGLSVLDEAGEIQLSVAEVEATLAWSSVWRLQPQFHLLVLHEPELLIKRDVDGRVQVAGFPVPATVDGNPAAKPGASALTWLLRQRELVVRGATVRWQDAMREQLPLVLSDVNLRLSARLDGYDVGLEVAADDRSFATLVVRGEVSAGAGLTDWQGRLYAALDGLDADRLARHVDLPSGLSAYGDLRGWLDFDGTRIVSAKLDMALSDLTVAWPTGEAPQRLRNISGRLIFEGRKGQVVAFRNLSLGWPDGEMIEPLDLELRARTTLAKLQEGGFVRANRIALHQFKRLVASAPLSERVSGLLAGLEPRGVLHDVSAEWLSDQEPFSRWKLRAGLRDVALAPYGDMPGIRGLSGSLEGDQQRGRVRLSMRDGALVMPKVFPSPELMIDTASLEGGWRVGQQGPELFVDELRFANQDAEGGGSGVYRPGVGRRGEIDLAVRLSRASGMAVPAYLPAVLNPMARAWLSRSLEGGHVPDARLRLRGKLDDFPFVSGEDGQFLVTAKVLDAQLNYAPGWPLLTGIHGDLRFEGAGMQLSADRAEMSGVSLKNVRAEIETLMNPDDRLLQISGTAEGATRDFLGFIADSPVRGYIGGLTDDFVAAGDGVLKLTIDIPLEDVRKTSTRGEYRFLGNRLTLLDGMPELVDAAGLVRFTEASFSVPEATAAFLGHKVDVRTPESAGGKPRFTVRGATGMAALGRWLDLPVMAHLSGAASWQADIALLDAGVSLSVTTDLEGVASSLPAPFNKRAAESWPVDFTLKALESGERRDMALNLAPRTSGALTLRGTGESAHIVRGGVALNAPLDSKEQGVKVTARFDELDIDAWQHALGLSRDSGVALPAWLAGSSIAVDVSATRVLLRDEVFASVELGALFDSANGVRGQVISDRAAGRFVWQGQGDGRLEAQMSVLKLGAEAPTDGVADARASASRPPSRLPAMDVSVDSLEWRGRRLGAATLKADVDQQYWRLRKLQLKGDNGEVDVSGRWLMGGYPVTELDFALRSANLGDWLASLGQEGVINGGTADVQGRLSWFDVPYRPDIQSLSGSLELVAENGEFRQLEPGVGRLLGVLSLQALPRRLSLDFRDVFSDGFAFDRVSGSIALDGGSLLTDDLHIAGPAAKVWIEGSADVLRETQSLDVVVQPTLSESVAIGAAAGLLNPAAGVLALFAQRVLSDPIERMFAYHYHLSGSWAEPLIEKRQSPRQSQRQESP